MKHNLVIWLTWFMNDRPTTDTNTHPSVLPLRCHSAVFFTTAIFNHSESGRDMMWSCGQTNCCTLGLGTLSARINIFTILRNYFHNSYHKTFFHGILRYFFFWKKIDGGTTAGFQLHTQHFNTQTLPQRRMQGCKFGDILALTTGGEMASQSI